MSLNYVNNHGMTTKFSISITPFTNYRLFQFNRFSCSAQDLLQGSVQDPRDTVGCPEPSPSVIVTQSFLLVHDLDILEEHWWGFKYDVPLWVCLKFSSRLDWGYVFWGRTHRDEVSPTGHHSEGSMHCWWCWSWAPWPGPPPKVTILSPKQGAFLDPMESVFQEVEDSPSKSDWSTSVSGDPDTNSQESRKCRSPWAREICSGANLVGLRDLEELKHQALHGG